VIAKNGKRLAEEIAKSKKQAEKLTKTEKELCGANAQLEHAEKEIESLRGQSDAQAARLKAMEKKFVTA
jgi:predicted  nucleic acid-binding Zn-ribbon protein